MDIINKPLFNRKEWNENNKEKIALNARKYYEKNKNDPEFMQLKRNRTKQRRDALKELNKLNNPIIESFNIETTEEEPIKQRGRPRKY